MCAKSILVVGSGFAGLWAALGAARKLDELGIPPSEVTVEVINRDPYHSIRVRNYEADLSAVRVPLADLLEPVGIRFVQGEVTALDCVGRHLTLRGADGEQVRNWDRLVLAAGGPLVRPAHLDGLTEHAFDVDTYDGASRLHAHLATLAARKDRARSTALVVGAGLVGIEIACELPAMLRAAGVPPADVRVILADHADHIGSTMGPHAIPVIAEALAALQIETRTGVSVTSVDRAGASLADGSRIDAATVVWCAGMRASPLSQMLPAEHDGFGRVAVDNHMQVCDIDGIFAAGDVATAPIDPQHASVMSCQHGRPMGRFAGHNVVCDLLGEAPLPLEIDWYVTVLDLGPWGALYTEGWDRHVVATGMQAKRTKQAINCRRIVPPTNRDRRALLDAAAPVVQTAPASYRARD
ncbi:MAG: FAD-dependent oxidoreductase [Pirellulales bacterium]